MFLPTAAMLLSMLKVCVFTEVVKLSERGQRHYSHHNDVFGFDSSSAILKIEWRVAGQVLTAHV